MTAADSHRPASPCIGVCRIDPAHGWCIGCWRSLDEIAGWAHRSAEDQRAVLACLEPRRAAHVTPLTGPER